MANYEIVKGLLRFARKSEGEKARFNARSAIERAVTIVSHQKILEGVELVRELPEEPAALYNLGGPLSIFDPATGKVDGGNWVWVIYTPWATEETTGLPTTPAAPGAPWIMRPGTASSHIMIVQPREPEPEAKP